ncbi:hypothetical protein L1987_67781 [Smallanthus sonchifolius]|uniref:Uncharacterized protein n=1 Tax=Smallanthus sonchifolius TaxID=185202 RepID=A0ACB9B3Q3_9ASTR|nr:hypothetical protein L1987_67781 [Smallanthus sonchifolius]
MSIVLPKPDSDSVHIREVWNDNLVEEFALIRQIVDDYPYIAMDTEFPGVVLRPLAQFKNINDYNYVTLKDNVDMLKLIQLGLTFSDENGNLPTCGTDKPCIWQFNFREFNVNEDIFANDSIEMLKQCGIDFKKNSEMGIDANRFGELLMSSGVVLNDNIFWVTFHSGYDFGYLLKLLTCKELPKSQMGFFDLIKRLRSQNDSKETQQLNRSGGTQCPPFFLFPMDTPSSWDSLRKQARNLEAELDDQMHMYRKLVSTKVDDGNNASNLGSSVEQLHQVISKMQAWVSSGGSEIFYHTLTRHQEIHHDLTQEFNRLRSSIRAKREHASLLEDFREFDRARLDMEEGGGSQEQSLLKERATLMRNTGQVWLAFLVNCTGFVSVYGDRSLSVVVEGGVVNVGKDEEHDEHSQEIQKRF